MAEKKTTKCETCKNDFKQNEGRGRPRLHCKKCRPPRTEKK
jgi:hypothetical protein